jgi:tellurite resistance protein TerC
MEITLFPLAEYWWFYLGFTGFVLLLLALDLGVFHRSAHSVSFREAVTWSVIWVTLSLTFNYLFYQYALWKFPQDPRLMAIPGFNAVAAANQVALEFLSGYVVEKSLSVDNIFVFVLVFGYFAVPAKLQHRVLFYGILGALIFRAIFIAIGAALMKYQMIVWIFGAFLLYTGFKLFGAEDKELEPDKNPIVKILRRLLPIVPMEGQKFFLRINGRLHATTLLVALMFLEATDIVFAVDSVPAIFGLTREPLIVFTSNIFAILGLRAMYFMLANAMDKFHMLKYGLAIVLIFVGSKMTWLGYLYKGHFPITASLAIILGVITLSIVLSLLFPKKEEEKPG